MAPSPSSHKSALPAHPAPLFLLSRDWRLDMAVAEDLEQDMVLVSHS